MAELKLAGLGLRSYGDVIFNTDGAYDVGKSGATRPRNIYFTERLQSTSALATPSALAATQFTAFASTVSGATLMGYGTTGDVTLKNRAGTTVAYVGPNTTKFWLAGALDVAGAASFTTGAFSSTVTITSNAGLSIVGGANQITLGHAATNSTQLAFGVGPGGQTYLSNTKSGSGAYADFAIYTSDLQRFTITTAGAVTVAQTFTSTGNLTVGSSTFVVTAATGAITSTAVDAVFAATGTSTSGRYIHFSNTSGDAYIGINGSTAAGFLTGGTAYDTTIAFAGGLAFGVVAGAQYFRLTSTQATFATPLAITGALTGVTTLTASGIGTFNAVTDAAAIQINRGGVAAANIRWSMQAWSTEAGSNVGSDYALVRHTDGGGYLGIGLLIGRSDGRINITPPPAFAAGDKYLVLAASGEIHVSAVGPAS